VRVAFLSPLPPAPTGIADYAAEVLAILAPRHAIDLFHAQQSVDRERLPGSCAVHAAESFLALHSERPYEAVVYQMGNGGAHDFLYPLLTRVSGLLVLHDLVLHHARARSFLASPAARAYAAAPWSEANRREAQHEIDAYEAEVARSHPREAPRLVAAQLGTVGDLLPYAYPLFRAPVEASRATAVHNRFMAETVAAEVAGAQVALIPMPVVGVPVSAEARVALRRGLGFADDDFVVGCFGRLTREKRIETVARAIARAAATRPNVRLLLVGPAPERAALDATLARLGVDRLTMVTGHVPFDSLAAHLEATDLVVQLRYPTARETSAALLRALAQGRPTVISDLEHLADIPDDAVLRADVTDEEGAVTRAILRLADRPEARNRLGLRAAAFVRSVHTPAAAAGAYEAALEMSRVG
jgi:glycosyltransferase involved in cell wall biosynthesis